jgi:hypothetical protein
MSGPPSPERSTATNPTRHTIIAQRYAEMQFQRYWKRTTPHRTECDDSGMATHFAARRHRRDGAMDRPRLPREVTADGRR